MFDDYGVTKKSNLFSKTSKQYQSMNDTSYQSELGIKLSLSSDISPKALQSPYSRFSEPSLMIEASSLSQRGYLTKNGSVESGSPGPKFTLESPSNIRIPKLKISDATNQKDTKAHSQRSIDDKYTSKRNSQGSFLYAKSKDNEFYLSNLQKPRQLTDRQNSLTKSGFGLHSQKNLKEISTLQGFIGHSNDSPHRITENSLGKSRHEVTEDFRRAFTEKFQEILNQQQAFLDGFNDSHGYKSLVAMCFRHLNILTERIYNHGTDVLKIDRGLLTLVTDIEQHVLKVFRKSEKALSAQLETIKKLQDESMKKQRDLDALEPLKKLEASLTEENLKAKKAISEYNTKIQANENKWKVEKSVLNSQISQLHNKIVSYEETGPVVKLSKELEAVRSATGKMIENLENMVESRDIQLAKYQMTIGNLKLEVDQQKKQNAELLAEIAMKDKRLESYEEKLANVAVTRDELRETGQMQKEDYDSLYVSYKRMKEMNLHLRERISALSVKIDRLNKIQAGTISHATEEDYSKERNLISAVSEHFLSGHKFLIYVGNPKKWFSVEEEDTNKLAVNPSDVKIEKFALFKPNFFLFLEQKYLYYSLTPQFAETQKKIDTFLIGTIRAIFDCKFNEHLLHSNPRNYSRFSDFVYSWLSNFTVDKTTRQVRALNFEEQADVEKRRMDFLVHLKNPKLNKIWDVMTFRELIEEKCSIDELHFFLMCRSMLFGGPQLYHSGSTFVAAPLLLFEKVDKFVEHVLKHFETENVAAIRLKLQERATKRGKNMMIDSGLVLRVLLECYKTERKVRYLMLLRLFKQILGEPNDNKGYLNFDLYKQFMDSNYPQLSELEKVQLFREAWNIGIGYVTADSFYVAATEAGLFVKTLNLKPFESIHRKECVEQMQKTRGIIAKEHEKLAEFRESLLAKAKTLGLEELLLEIKAMDKEVEQNFNIEKIHLNGRSIYLHYFDIIPKLLQVRNIYIQNKWFPVIPQQEELFAQKDFEVWGSLFGCLTEIDTKDTAEAMYKERKVRTVQLCFERKISNWYLLMGAIRAKLREGKENKKLPGHEGSEKTVEKEGKAKEKPRIVKTHSKLGLKKLSEVHSP